MYRILLCVLLGAWIISCNSSSDSGAGGAAPRYLASESPATNHGEEFYRVLSERDEIISVLKNGMTVIARRVASPVMSVRGYVAAGSIYEGRWLGGGLSHLLEHLLAGGSNARRTEEQNRDLLQELGNNSNAYTYADRTVYYVNTTTDKAEGAIDLVTGWMLTAKIPQAEFEREYEVVQRELQMDEGDADRVLGDLGAANRYRVSPARIPVVGYQEVIRGLTRDDVYAYYRLAYVPNNMVFVVAGDADPEKLLSLVQKYVKDMPPGRAFAHTIDPEPQVAAPRSLVATFPKLGQARVQLAFPSVKITENDLYALDVLSAVLGSGESSMLVEDIRDKQQLVTAISAHNPTPPYVEGSFVVDFQCEPEKIQPATRAIEALLESTKDKPVEAQRIKRAQTQLITSSIYSRQTSEAIADSLADGYLSTGDPHFIDHYNQRVSKVAPQDLARVARKYLNLNQLVTTALLPEESVGADGLPKAQQMLTRQSGTNPSAATRPTSQITRSVLDDGTVLLLKRAGAAPVVSISLYAAGGLTREDAASNGLGNFAMTMLSRGAAGRDAAQIARALDDVGAVFEAGCDANTWHWGATCLKGDLPQVLAIFGDLVEKPTFPEAEIAPVKQRVLAAIEGQDADWYALGYRYFRRMLFEQRKSPYQFLSIGTATNVEAITRDRVSAWYRDKILPAPRVLSIFGDIDEAAARELAVRCLGSSAIRRTPPQPRALRPPPKPQEPTRSIEVSRVEVQKSNNPYAAVFVGFESDSTLDDSQNPVFDVADCLTSGYGFPTGYIFEILRGRGLVYDANAFNFPGNGSEFPGAFVAYGGCEPKNVTPVVDVILESIARLQGSDQDIKPQWFERSKRLITTGDAVDLESPLAQAGLAARDELAGLGYNFHAAYADRIGKVSMGDVRGLAAARLKRCIVTVSTSAPQAVQIKPGIRNYTAFPPVDLAPKGVQHDAAPAGK